MTHKARSVAS